MKDRFVFDLVSNTIVVMTKLPEKRDEWAQAINQFLISSKTDNDVDLINLLEAIALALSGKPLELIQPQFSNFVYDDYWKQIIREINSAAKLPDSRIMDALHDLIRVPTVDELISVLRDRGREFLDYREEDVDFAFQNMVNDFRDHGDQQLVELIEARRILIVRCRRLGVDAAINSLTEPTNREWISSRLKEMIHAIIHPAVPLPSLTLLSDQKKSSA